MHALRINGEVIIKQPPSSYVYVRRVALWISNNKRAYVLISGLSNVLIASGSSESTHIGAESAAK